MERRTLFEHYILAEAKREKDQKFIIENFGSMEKYNEVMLEALNFKSILNYLMKMFGIKSSETAELKSVLTQVIPKIKSQSEELTDTQFWDNTKTQPNMYQNTGTQDMQPEEVIDLPRGEPTGKTSSLGMSRADITAKIDSLNIADKYKKLAKYVLLDKPELLQYLTFEEIPVGQWVKPARGQELDQVSNAKKPQRVPGRNYKQTKPLYTPTHEIT